LAVAAIFTFIVPKKPLETATGPRRFLLRWGHALVWVFLAGWCFASALGWPGVGNILGLGAGLTYAAFLLALLAKP
jgi:hypothetical protein